MATGAAGADVAIVLVDAVLGVQAQTRRHILIAGLMGVGTMVCVVNKMDRVGFDAGRFAAVKGERWTLCWAGGGWCCRPARWMGTG